MHGIRENCREEGLYIFLQDHLSMKIRDDLSNILDVAEFFSKEM